MKKTKRIICYAFLSQLFFNSGQILAQNEELGDLLDMDLESLMNLSVSTASMREEKITEAPGIISVISKQQIANYQADNLVDVLSRLPSIANASTGRFRNNIISIRGKEFTQYGTHVLYLLNGRPVRDSATGGINSPLLNGIPLSSIEQIEVIRGPGSPLYGTNAFAGVVNIKTKSAGIYGSNAWVSMKGSSFESRRLEGGANFAKDGFAGSIGFKFSDSRGENYSYTDRDGITLTPDWFEDNRGILLNLSYKGFEFNGASFRRHTFSMQTGFRWNIPEDSNVDRLSHDMFDISYSTALSDNHEFKAFYTRNEMTWVYDKPTTAATSDLYEVRFIGDFNEDLDYVVGALMETIDPMPKTGVVHRVRTSKSLYWQSSYHVTKSLKIIGGTQWNKPEGGSGRLSPRAGIIYHWNDKLTYKFLIGNAFRSGTFLDFDTNTSSLIGNPDLEPETVTTIDFSIGYIDQTWSASAVYFHSELDGTFSRRLAGINETTQTVYNADGWVYDGVEFEGEILLTSGLKLFANASWQTSKNKTSGNSAEAPFPKFMIKMGGEYTLPEFQVSVYAGFFTAPPPAGGIDANPDPDDYLMLTASARIPLPKVSSGAGIKFALDNILDEEIWFSENHRNVLRSVRLHSGRSFSAEFFVNF